MKKKVIISAISLVLSLTFMYAGIHKRTKTDYACDVDMLYSAFKSSEAVGLNKELYFFAKLNEDLDLEEIADSISKRLYLDETDPNYSFTNIINDKSQVIQINAVTENNELVNISGHIIGNDNEKTERYLIVDITGDYDETGLLDLKHTVETFMKDRGFKFTYNLGLTGYIEGRLEMDELNNLLKKVFQGVSAKKIEGIRDNNLISISAYSPAVKNYISVDGNKINLNVAIRYNSYENSTYIWLATPVIAKGY